MKNSNHWIYILTIGLLIPFYCSGQELFPFTEQASTLPKNKFSLRFSACNFQEPLGRPKYWTGIKAMYGVTRKFTVIATVSASNHHLKTFPGNLLDYFRYHHTRRYPSFPYLLEGFHFYGKYRIVSVDGDQKHLRIALYGEGSKTFGVHDVAEPNLQGDNTGIGGGFIVTQLKKRWALSFTGGLVVPFTYKDSLTSFKSGNMVQYNVSTGYRIYPATYNSYSDVNINLYIEILGKSYSRGDLKIKGSTYEIKNFLLDEDIYTYNTLIGNSFIEARPAVQLLFNSETRIDIGVAIPVNHKSYLGYYPIFFLNIQRYFL